MWTPDKNNSPRIIYFFDIEHLTDHDVFRVRQNIHDSWLTKLLKLLKTLLELHISLNNYDVIINYIQFYYYNRILSELIPYVTCRTCRNQFIGVSINIYYISDF